jgi:uncharacterized protein with GYD domain
MTGFSEPPQVSRSAHHAGGGWRRAGCWRGSHNDGIRPQAIRNAQRRPAEYNRLAALRSKAGPSNPQHGYVSTERAKVHVTDWDVFASQSAIVRQAVENSASRMQRLQNREEKMPLFITYASYSHSGVKGLVNKPEDRSGAVKALIEKAGGKLVALYNTTGSNDVVLVSELADGSDAVAMGMAVAASGALAKIETVRAWTPSEFKGIAEKAARVASAYTPPGK